MLLRSNIIKESNSLQSSASRLASSTRSTAVSVEWWTQNVDFEIMSSDQLTSIKTTGIWQQDTAPLLTRQIWFIIDWYDHGSPGSEFGFVLKQHDVRSFVWLKDNTFDESATEEVAEKRWKLSSTKQYYYYYFWLLVNQPFLLMPHRLSRRSPLGASGRFYRPDSLRAAQPAVSRHWKNSLVDVHLRCSVWTL